MTSEQIAAQRKQMLKDMKIAFKHFDLPEAVQRTAKMAALGSQGAAAGCYRAIARSLGK